MEGPQKTLNLAPGPKLPVTPCTSVLFSDQLLGDASSTATCGVDKGLSFPSTQPAPRTQMDKGLSYPSTQAAPQSPGLEERAIGTAFQLCGVADRHGHVGPGSPDPQVSCSLLGLDSKSQRQEFGTSSTSLRQLTTSRDIWNMVHLGCLCLVLGAGPAPHRPAHTDRSRLWVCLSLSGRTVKGELLFICGAL